LPNEAPLTVCRNIDLAFDCKFGGCSFCAWNSFCRLHGHAPNFISAAGCQKRLAQKLYIAKCAKCHKFYDPAAYSDEEWRTWMHKMSKKAKLSAEQELSLSSYIEATYRGGSKTNAPGAESQQ